MFYKMSWREQGGKRTKGAAVYSILAIVLILVLFGHGAMADYAPPSGSQRFDISVPSLNVAEALNRLAKQTGAMLLFPHDVAVTRQARPVVGRYTLMEALMLLLRDSGFSGDLSKNGVVLISLVDVTEQNNQEIDMNTLEDQPGKKLSSFIASGGIAKEASNIDNGYREEIIVTAQKKKQTLLEVPVPVTAISAETLTDKNQFRIQDYYSRIPGLSISSSELAPTIAIRGVVAAAGGNPTVGIIVDDMPLGSSTSIGGGYFAPELDPADFSRIEVLRGPQGTLYGASSIGGLLKYVTVEPSVDAFRGNVQVGANTVEGGREGYKVSASVNVPVGNAFAVRVSGFSKHEAGYIDNVRPGGNKDANESNIDGGIMSAAWTPNDKISIKISALYQDNEVSAYPYLTEEYPALEDLEQSFVPNSGSNTRTFKVYNAKVNYKLGVFDLVAITGYSESGFIYTFDYSNIFGEGGTDDFLGTSHALVYDDSTTDKFIQEFRLSTTVGESVEWLVGSYFGDEESPWSSEVVGANDDGSTIGQLFLSKWNSSLKELSIFTNLTYRFNDQFDIQVGGRKANIEQSFEEIDTGIFFETLSPFVTPKEIFREDATTYLFTPRYKLLGNTMMYLRFASGYRPGGINAGPLTGLPESNAYASDETRNLELGVKGRAFDNKLTYDVSLYKIDWRDIQLALTDPGTGLSYFSNGGEGESQGLELTIEYVPTSRFIFDGWIALTDARLTQDMPAEGAFGLYRDRLPYSAQFSAYASVEYAFAMGEYEVHIGGDVSYIGDRTGDFLTIDAPREKYDSYMQLNVAAGLSMGQWAVDFYLNNATNERGYIGGGAGTTIPKAFQVIQPRTFGLSMSRTFE